MQPVVLGLDFGGTKIAAAVADIDGTRLGSATIAAEAEQGAAVSLSRAVDAAHALLGQVAADRPLTAVGASTFGIPGPDGVALAPAIPGWEQLRLGQELEAAFAGAEIRLATDVKAAARAEAAWGALAGCDPGVYLNLGTGLAVAVVAGGTVLKGHNGAAGEIGYNLRGLADVGRSLDARVPLEDAVSGRALESMARHAQPGVDGPGRFFASTHEKADLKDILDHFLDELAFHLVNLTIAVDPERIAVGGGMMRSWEQIGPRLRVALDAAVPFPPELVPAAFPFDAPLIGALALALEAAADPHRNPQPSLQKG
jgi:glucokinase